MSHSSPLISAEQKANLQEVTDLMLQIYETLGEMRYIDPKGIVRGPHNITSVDEVDVELDPTILYLYSILPYIDEQEAGQTDFFHGGCFVDFRQAADVERGRDPFYADPKGDFEAENGQYIRAWATPLSVLGNHGTVIIYDARQHRIWAIDQEGWGTTDPALCSEAMLKGTAYENVEEKSDWGDDSTGDYEYEDEGDGLSHISGNSSEFWSDDDELSSGEIDHLCKDQKDEETNFDEGFEVLEDAEQREAEEATRSRNTNSFDHIRSRPAGDFLRSVIQWYRELREVPGQGEYSGWLEPDLLRPLYLKNGWPNDFDGDAFEVDYARTYCVKRAKYFAEEPLRQVDCYDGWLEYVDRDIERHSEELTNARTEDEKWTARFNIWQAEQRRSRNKEDIRMAKSNAELRCPGGVCQRKEDLPLWEMEMLRIQSQGQRHDMPQELSESSSPSDRRKRKEAAIYAQAYELSVADAKRLCPGQTFEQATGIKSLGQQGPEAQIEQYQHGIDSSRKEVQKLREWAAQLPEASDVPHTSQLIDQRIKDHERSEEYSREHLERNRKWLAEHGNIASTSLRKATGGMPPRKPEQIAESSI